MHVLNRIGVAAAVSAAAAISVALAIPANADTAAQPGDAVFVGSDTVQNSVNFALDGSPGVAGGYNSIGNLHRAINVDANGDANGRGVYDGTCTYTQKINGTAQTPVVSGCENTSLVVNNSTTTTTVAPNLIGGSVVLRAGTKPVTRPNGSGAGDLALIADSQTTGYQGLPTGSIQIARLSRLPNAAEIGSCPAGVTATNPCGGLHVYKIGQDNLTIAHQATGFAGPPALSVEQLVKIYSCTATTWNQVGGTSTATIHPLIPQTGSGTRNFFLSDLAIAAGTTTFNPGACVRAVQEHDPSGIANDSTPTDAIEPFSGGKIKLLNSGYFTTGATGSPSAAAFTAGYLATESGTASDGVASYASSRGLFLTVRQPDVGSTTPFQPGAAANFATSLITDEFSAFRSTAGRSQIAQAGFDAGTSTAPVFKDCGINPSSC